MNWIAIICAGIVVFACLGGLFLGWKNFLTIRKSHKNYLKEITDSTWVTVCGLLVRTSDSLLMKNNGDDPCKSKETIPYINYIKDIDMFYEVAE